MILYKSSSIRKNLWKLNYSRVSGAMGQKLLSQSNIDYATTVCLQCGHARRKLPNYSSLNSQEMPLSFKHIFAIIPYTMPLFWRCPYIHGHGMVRIYMCPKVMFITAPFRPDAFSWVIIFLLRSVTKYYMTLKITASVLHGLRKRVRELMVSENRWLTLHVLYKKLQDDNLALRVSIEPSYRHQLQRIDSRLTCKCSQRALVFCRTET